MGERKAQCQNQTQGSDSTPDNQRMNRQIGQLKYPRNDQWVGDQGGTRKDGNQSTKAPSTQVCRISSKLSQFFKLQQGIQRQECGYFRRSNTRI
ncbi:hypothetical protein ASG71_10000 [Arthrobacter sp. Soil763]|nr:hypothetical protein ASG71_10000 [Arthrobacter sp. Soil763]